MKKLEGDKIGTGYPCEKMRTDSSYDFWEPKPDRETMESMINLICTYPYFDGMLLRVAVIAYSLFLSS